MTQNAVSGRVMLYPIIVAHCAYLAAPLRHTRDIFSVARSTLHVCKADVMERFCPTAVTGETCRLGLVVSVVTALAQSVRGVHCRRLVAFGAGQVGCPMHVVREVTYSVFNHVGWRTAGSHVTPRTIHCLDLAMVAGIATSAAWEGRLTVLVQWGVAIRAGQARDHVPLVCELPAMEFNGLAFHTQVAL